MAKMRSEGTHLGRFFLTPVDWRNVTWRHLTISPLYCENRHWREKSRLRLRRDCEAHRWPKILKKISLYKKLQADSKNGVQIEIQAKTGQVMGPQKVLSFEKNLFYPKLACP